MNTRILVSDKLSKEGLDILEASGIPVVMKPGLSEEELCREIAEYDALIIRSGTNVTRKVIDAAKRLRVIGRAGVGVDNVDVPYATERGILVMNTPTANILSAAEHTCAMILSLARNIPFAHASMHEGRWDRSRFTGVELNGKVLGIIGVGRVGGEVVKRLRPFNMTMIGYDPFLPKEVADNLGVKLYDSPEEVYRQADFMTIHTPLLPSTRNMISMPQFRMMKPTARIANVARGGIVNEDDLYTALKEHVIAGAAFDVWCSEPPSPGEQKLLELDNLVTTPHLGASTVEAQERVAVDIAEAAVRYLRDGVITNAINAPRGKLDPESAPYVPLAERMGVFMQSIVDAPITEAEVIYYGGLAARDTKLLTVSAVKGLITGIVGKDNANIINALPVAKSKGIDVKESKTDRASNYSNMIELKVVSGGRALCIRGSVFGEEPRLVNYCGYRFNVAMSGDLVFLSYRDQPGVVGKVGTVLSAAGVNIVQMAVSAKEGSDKAMMVITVDRNLDKATVGALAAAAGGEAKFSDIAD